MSGSSALEKVRALYASHLDPEPLRLPVGRKAQGQVVVCYMEQDWSETQESRANWLASDDPKAPLYAGAEILAKSCVDILLRDDENGTSVGELPGKYLTGFGLEQGPASFHAVAQALGRPLGDDPEKAALTAVFQVLGSDWEVERHQAALAAWEPTVASPEVEATIAGESATAGSTSP